MSSSLSRAVKNAAAGGRSGSTSTINNVNSSSSSPWQKQQHGKFESCFAQGLDLTEFSDEATTTKNATTTVPIVSASAQLLKIKQQESQQRYELERQDAMMEQVAHDRAKQYHLQQQELRDACSKNVAIAAVSQDHRKVSGGGSRDSKLIMGSLLVQMHSGDDTALRRSKASRKMDKVVVTGIRSNNVTGGIGAKVTKNHQNNKQQKKNSSGNHDKKNNTNKTNNKKVHVVSKRKIRSKF